MSLVLHVETNLLTTSPRERQFHCEQFASANLGVTQLILASQTPAVTLITQQVGSAIRRELTVLFGPSIPGKCGGTISSPLDCLADGIRKRVLIFVCDNNTAVDGAPSIDALLAHFLQAPEFGQTQLVLPIVQPNAAIQTLFARVPQLAKIQLSRWQRQPSMNAIDALQYAGLVDDDQRIFISYKRTDSSEMADQLAIELTKLNFHIFLDRFSVGVGVDFQPRIMQELADKAVVVALESPHLLDSNWVRDEIDFARIHGIGVVAINWPGSPTIDSVADDQRVYLSATDFTAPATTMLTATALQQITEKIRKEHARSLFRRKWALAHNIEKILTAASVAGLKFDEHGLLEARDRKGATHKILALSRPGDVLHYHYLDELRSSSSPSHGGIIVSSVPFRETLRRKRNEWLATKANIQYFHEGDIHNLVGVLA